MNLKTNNMETNNFLQVLNSINDLTDLKNFYSISAVPTTNQISLQGYFSEANTRLAKELEVDLVYDPSTLMVSGSSKDNKIRIVLT
jgi:hypothetical protein